MSRWHLSAHVLVYGALLGRSKEPVQEPASGAGEPPLARLVVRIGGRVILVETESIDWIEAADYARACTPRGDRT